ncbi:MULTISPECIES: DUF3427 domain-containing protein [unclassified Vagococcus]|uniref:DUF3427 domain-containing protein n=1 Tax=unclassified Vagococcus TaxID=2648499 RepID=UPI001F50ABA4|nr:MULTISPECIES: DUF3427 domain-containing protein [unclassified Vagococcus]MCI0130296.1 DUF3427 domain-containing protein [Vagococcus sp. CY53-2]UNM89734.1 DUF3427 domain-containing protein [Vagococcus sp. CY52-2]
MEIKGLELTLFFKEAKKNDSFILFLKDVIDTGLKKLESKGMPDSLQLYSKYRRKDVLRLLNMKFNQNEQGIGGYAYNNNQFVIFVALAKGKESKASLMAYEEVFIDEQTFHWFTKPSRTIDSPVVTILRDSENWTIHLFIKRKYNQQDRETDVYYVGEMNPIIETIEQNKKPTSDNTLKNVVEMDFLLKNRVEPNMYEFLTGNLD